MVMMCYLYLTGLVNLVLVKVCHDSTHSMVNLVFDLTLVMLVK